MIVGALIGAAVSWHFARKGSEEIREYYVNTQTALKELAHAYSTLKTQLADAARALQQAKQPDEAARIQALLVSEEKKETAIIAKLPKPSREAVRAELAPPLENCPVCGDESICVGWRPTGSGSPMIHYRCEKHGMFPGSRISDLWDD